ncbi:MAG TPA: FAD-dependent oxidoreductase [Candidatus Anoxymicrobiaceae bacterium]|jgi:diapolycopene oxygenase
MPQREITIVGAGLSGLTAAIILARDGFDVTVLDKEKRHGGRPEFRNKAMRFVPGYGRLS